MKNISIITILVLGLSLSINTFAQGPPEPPSENGTNGTQEGNTGPIGSGIAILLGLGAAYGGKKLYDSRSKKEVNNTLL